MYKVFVNHVPIILSTEKNIGDSYRSISIKDADLPNLIDEIRDGKLTHLNLFHKKHNKLLKHFKKQLKTIVAGGGLVFNERSEALFIHRKGLWDLPKGKAEKQESIEETAIREVEEETGVHDLKIIQPLETTYHVLKRNGKYRLKETFWFEMNTDFKGALKPQKEESIDKAVWKNFEQSQKALQNSYSNIKLLFPNEYLLGFEANAENE
jgi:8-oxo-dGTP pyrophosphatase MutT (NUDIX family)